MRYLLLRFSILFLVIEMRYEILRYNKIRDMRNDRDLSQKQIADRLKIAQNTLSQYETGERNIPNEILIQLAIIYDTSTDYLLGLTDKKEPYPRKEKQPYPRKI